MAAYRVRARHRQSECQPVTFHLLGQILQFHPEAIVVTDTEGRIGAASGRFLRWFSHGAQALRTRAVVTEVVSQEDVHNYVNILKYVIRENKAVRGFKLRTTIQDTEQDLRLSVIPMHDTEQRVVAMIHLFERAAEKELHQNMDHLEKLTNIGQIAAGMAHELNTPLGSIILSADVIGDTDLSGLARVEITKVKQQAKHCSEVVRRLLDYARHEDDSRECHEVSAIIRKVMSLVETETKKHNIELTMEIACSTDDISCNENQLEQLFFNLFSNSLHAVGDGGHISIQIIDDSLLNHVIVLFSDDGGGISPQYLDRVFEPFFTTKPRTEGTGLGLALCRKIVLAHGGTIQVESEPGEGTTFRLSFPAAQ